VTGAQRGGITLATAPVSALAAVVPVRRIARIDPTLVFRS